MKLTVRKGDNLTKLAATYNKAHGTHVTVAQLARANGLKDANRIRAGQTLRFPDVFEAAKKKPLAKKPVSTQPRQETKAEAQKRVDESILNVKNQPTVQKKPQSENVFIKPMPKLFPF